MHLEHADDSLYIKKKRERSVALMWFLYESSYCKNGIQITLTRFKQNFAVFYDYKCWEVYYRLLWSKIMSG